MKAQILFPILFCSVQFMGCKTTTQSLAAPQYPRNAELRNGYYGETMYTPTIANKQTECISCNRSSTVKPDYVDRMLPAAHISGSPLIIVLPAPRLSEK